jgi:spermidine/putrescine transport system permease protein
MSGRLSRIIWWFVGSALVLFMLSPLVLLVLFCFTSGTQVSFPISGFTLQWFAALFNSSEFRDAIQNSLIVTGSVGAVSTLVGTMAAMAMARMQPRISGPLMLCLSMPVMLPPLVLGVALLSFYASLKVPLGLRTVVLAHLVFTQPFVIMIVHARMASFNYAIIEAARDLGASRLHTFLTVTLPIAGPSIIGGCLVSMALSLDDFIVTFFTIGGGNTLPTFLWGMLRKGVNPTINVASFILLSLTILTSLFAIRLTRYRG